MRFVFLFLVLSIVYPHNAYSGAVAARQQQMQAMQEQAQAQAVQQYVQERQAQEIAAYQQAQAEAQAQAQMVAVAQYQAAQMEAARQQIMQQVVQAQIQAQVAAYIQRAQMAAAQQQLLKQAVEEELARQVMAQIQQGVAVQVQEQMIGQAIVNAAYQIKAHQVADMRDSLVASRVISEARNQQAQSYAGAVVAQSAIEQSEMARLQAMQMQAMQAKNGAVQMTSGAYVAGQKQYAPVDPSQIQDIVDMSEVWTKLEKNSKAWALLIDEQAKTMVVAEFIERFRKRGVKIQKQPSHYVAMIDEMSTQNIEMLNKSFMELLEIVAIMEYDFDVGKDKDTLARQILGPQAYEINRKRLGR
jgi:hypothetical protein